MMPGSKHKRRGKFRMRVGKIRPEIMTVTRRNDAGRKEKRHEWGRVLFKFIFFKLSLMDRRRPVNEEDLYDSAGEPEQIETESENGVTDLPTSTLDEIQIEDLDDSTSLASSPSRDRMYPFTPLYPLPPLDPSIDRRKSVLPPIIQVREHIETNTSHFQERRQSSLPPCLPAAGYLPSITANSSAHGITTSPSPSRDLNAQFSSVLPLEDQQTLPDQTGAVLKGEKKNKKERLAMKEYGQSSTADLKENAKLQKKQRKAEKKMQKEQLKMEKKKRKEMKKKPTAENGDQTSEGDALNKKPTVEVWAEEQERIVRRAEENLQMEKQKLKEMRKKIAAEKKQQSSDALDKIPTVEKWAKQEEKKKKTEEKLQKQQLKKEAKRQKKMEKKVAKENKKKEAEKLKERRKIEKETAKLRRATEKAEKAAAKAEEMRKKLEARQKVLQQRPRAMEESHKKLAEQPKAEKRERVNTKTKTEAMKVKQQPRQELLQETIPKKPNKEFVGKKTDKLETAKKEPVIDIPGVMPLSELLRSCRGRIDPSEESPQMKEWNKRFDLIKKHANDISEMIEIINIISKKHKEKREKINRLENQLQSSSLTQDEKAKLRSKIRRYERAVEKLKPLSDKLYDLPHSKSKEIGIIGSLPVVVPQPPGTKRRRYHEQEINPYIPPKEDWSAYDEALFHCCDSDSDDSESDEESFE